ncbi:MAG: acetyl-CoA carboxylase carboxyltransferase subunit alpha [Pseudomonadota bacterium]|nr:acetyl-CoA carboxylase carboxyl transferase subunit alpha [Gammaproteobacteria bacterium]MEE2684424.1 acetyl-CoA carboxylase carboxyltransferase subunit alpha [Pseudomonadota bacterium]
MDTKFIKLEEPIAELEAKIEELKFIGDDSTVNISEEISKLKNKSNALTKKIFSNLSSWDIVKISRHPSRPYTLDYIKSCFSDFHELHGDRMYADDESLVCGLAKLEERPVVLIGQQKGRDSKDRLRRNFGMAKPEGYRKSLRVMKLAEKFNLPIITFIDTPGAHPGLGAEKRGQSEAIARNIYEMVKLRTPVISIIIGEGGSGGALAIGVADRILMLQYSMYSVISPEGCSSILWKGPEHAKEAADSLGVTADRLHELGLVHQVIKEPLGGAHRDPESMSNILKKSIISSLNELESLSTDSLIHERQNMYSKYGIFQEE